MELIIYYYLLNTHKLIDNNNNNVTFINNFIPSLPMYLPNNPIINSEIRGKVKILRYIMWV